MADGQIEIIITAVNKISAQLKDIEGDIKNFGTQAQKQTEKTTTAFQDSTTTLLALGNAANTVDNIFSAYQNMQLRVENATERVTGASERLQDAQTKLNRLSKSGTASAEELADARKEVDRATRGLTIAENNLAKVQNQVVGTYINMGVQTVTLISSLPKLNILIRQTTFEVTGLTIAAGTLNIALGVIAVAVAAVTIAKGQLAKATQEVVEKEASLAQTIQNLSDPMFGLSEAIDRVKNEMRGLFPAQDISQQRRLVEIKKEELKLADLMRRNQGEIVEETGRTVGQEIAFQQGKIYRLKANYDADFTAFNELVNAKIELANLEASQNMSISTLTSEQIKTNQKNILNYIQTEYTPKILEEQAKIYDEEMNRLILLQKEYDNALEKKARLMGGSNFNPTAGRYEQPRGLLNIIRGNDFVVTKRGEIIQSHPDDTIIATKNPKGIGSSSGIVINIGTISGFSPLEISRALKRELGNKITI